jgi:predicted lipid-binding transport protein (Tim44 family)
MYNQYPNQYQNQSCCPYPYEQPEQHEQPLDLLCWCSDKVLGFLAFLFALTLGLILGAVFSAVIITALAALIILAVILLILIIAVLIIKRCKCCKHHCC